MPMRPQPKAPMAAFLLAAAALAAVALAAVALAATAAPAAAACPDADRVLSPSRDFTNRADLRVEVEYLGSAGVARVDAAGTHYRQGEGEPARGTLYYPEPYWYDGYALYLVGQPMRYRLKVSNVGKRALRDLEVSAVQEGLEFFGRDGDDLPGCTAATWPIKLLAQGASFEVVVTSALPPSVAPGLQQTHVQVRRAGNRGERGVLFDAPQAGVFCRREADGRRS